MRQFKNGADIKRFVKRASVAVITEWLTDMYNAGLNAGREQGYALAFDEMRAKVEEQKANEDKDAATLEAIADGTYIAEETVDEQDEQPETQEENTGG